VAVAALLWSLGGVLIKLAAWSPLGIASVRSAIAAFVIGGFLRWRTRRMPRILPRSRAAWGAALGYAATVVLFVWATKLTAAANAIVLQYSSPLFVAIAGHYVLGERVRLIEWSMLAVMVVGVVLLFAEQLSPTGMVGNALGLASGVAMAIMTLSVRAEREGSALEALVTGNLLAALVGVGTWGELPQLDAQTLAVLGVLGVVQLGVPYILFARALRSVRAIEAVMLAMLEPIANPLWVLLAIGERPSMMAALGGILVLGAISIRAILSYWGSASEEDSGSADSSGGTSP